MSDQAPRSRRYRLSTPDGVQFPTGRDPPIEVLCLNRAMQEWVLSEGDGKYAL